MIAPMSDTTVLTARPPKAHGTNGELVVFEMMADIDAVIRRKIGRASIQHCYAIVQILFRAHLLQQDLRASDLWVSMGGSDKAMLECLEQLARDGFIDCDPAVLAKHGDGRIALTAVGARCVGDMAESIVDILTSGFHRAGVDPFAPDGARRILSRDGAANGTMNGVTHGIQKAAAQGSAKDDHARQ
jgi:hypothetical protein